MFVDDDEAFYYCGCWIPIWAYGILRFVGVMAGPLAWLRLFHVDSYLLQLHQLLSEGGWVYVCEMVWQMKWLAQKLFV